LETLTQKVTFCDDDILTLLLHSLYLIFLAIAPDVDACSKSAGLLVGVVGEGGVLIGEAQQPGRPRVEGDRGLDTTLYYERFDNLTVSCRITLSNYRCNNNVRYESFEGKMQKRRREKGVN
jgi:hypothetical protein